MLWLSLEFQWEKRDSMLLPILDPRNEINDKYLNQFSKCEMKNADLIC